MVDTVVCLKRKARTESEGNIKVTQELSQARRE